MGDSSVTISNSRERLAQLRTMSEDDAATSLLALSSDPAPETRAWAIWAASKILSASAAIAVISPRIRDQDPDVADIALTTVYDIDPDAAARHVAHLQTQTASKDFFAPVRAAWSLARLGAKGAEPFITRMIETPAYPWHAKEATVAGMLLRGEGDEILGLLAGHHRHDLCRQLSHAAALIATEDAIDTLLRVHRNSEVDEECRTYADLALTEIAKAATPVDG